MPLQLSAAISATAARITTFYYDYYHRVSVDMNVDIREQLGSDRFTAALGPM